MQKSFNGRDEIRLHSTTESSVVLGGHIGFGWIVKLQGKIPQIKDKLLQQYKFLCY